MLEIGLKNECTTVVNETNTAKTIGSGSLDVFATPMMIALIEKASAQCVASHIDEGMTTVGTLVNVQHLSATPLGMTVTASCELTEIDNRRLVFAVEAKDERGIIGKGTHERFIVNAQKFMDKTNSK